MKVYIRMWCVIITTRNPQKWLENLRHKTTIHPGHIYFVSRNKWNIFVTFNYGSVLLCPCRYSFHPSFANFPEFLLVIANRKFSLLTYIWQWWVQLGSWGLGLLWKRLLHMEYGVRIPHWMLQVSLTWLPKAEESFRGIVWTS